LLDSSRSGFLVPSSDGPNCREAQIIDVIGVKYDQSRGRVLDLLKELNHFSIRVADFDSRSFVSRGYPSAGRRLDRADALVEDGAAARVKLDEA